LHSALAFASPIAAQEHDYAVGQVWAYRTAPGDEGFLIKMQEIEEIGPEGQALTVYHISISALLYRCRPDGWRCNTFQCRARHLMRQ
jgi:hypothetical protein